MKFRNELPSDGGSKNYLKLKDKESVTGIFMGDIHEFFVVWENGKSRIVPEGTPRSSFRFKINFVIKNGSVFEPKIWENGSLVYSQLRELHEEYKLDQIVVKVTRNGTGMDTTYSVLPLLKQVISPETMAYLQKLELLSLDAKESAHAPSFQPDDEIPF
ncbi:MAG: hypothetical protein ABL927_10990 [Bdellovibrionales bacterium]